MRPNESCPTPNYESPGKRRFSGGGGNRTRVRGRTEQSVYERSPCLISPTGRFTDDQPTGQPILRRHTSGDQLSLGAKPESWRRIPSLGPNPGRRRLT